MPNLIKFRFQPLKTVQVAASILKFNSGSLSCPHLLKLLYLADRLALKRIDAPLTGDSYQSTHSGLILLTRVHEVIKESKANDVSELWIWRNYISTIEKGSTDDLIRLLHDPGDGELSEQEDKIIQEVCRNWGINDKPLPECKFSNELIPVEVILNYLGKTEEQIHAIAEIVDRERYLDELLSR